MHPSRRQSQAHLDDLARQDQWEELYRRTMLWEFPDDALLGFQLAFYRPFAVPRMARILASSGAFSADTEKRSYDTGLVMYEIIHAGLDSPVGHRMIALMNRMHRRWDIPQDDFTYILNAFIVVPLRHIERVGWRKPLDVERAASWRFYRRLGELMGILTLPTSYDEAATMLDQYEAQHVRTSEDGRRLGAAVLQVLRRRLPAPLRPIAPQVNAALIGDPRVAAAIGLPSAGAVEGLILNLSRVTGRLTAAKPAPTRSWFTPGQPAGQIYPHGYHLDDLDTHPDPGAGNVHTLNHLKAPPGPTE